MNVEVDFDTLVETAPYGIVSYLAVNECRKLRATNKNIRLQIPHSMQEFYCGYRGHLKWISGHESSLLDGPISKAKYNGIRSMSCTSSGTVVVADTNNGVVRALRHGKADVLTSRGRCFALTVLCKGEDVYLGMADGIEHFSLASQNNIYVLRHSPKRLFSFSVDAEDVSIPFAMCWSGTTDTLPAVLFTTFGTSRISINESSKHIKGATLHGICAYSNKLVNGALVCDTGNNQILLVDAEGNSSFFLAIPSPRCIEKLGTTLFVSSETFLYEIRRFESKPMIIKHDLDNDLPWVGHYVSSLTATPDGTLLVGTYSQIFAFL
jgi:hypothetical protein